MAADLKSIAIASLLSSAIANVVLFAVVIAIGAYPDPALGSLVFAVWLVGCAIANAVIAATLGLVWRAIAAHNGWNAHWCYWLPGLLVGAALPFTAINGSAFAAGEFASVLSWLSPLLPVYVLGAALGGLTALFAWLIRRPDRDARIQTEKPAP